MFARLLFLLAACADPAFAPAPDAPADRVVPLRAANLRATLGADGLVLDDLGLTLRFDGVGRDMLRSTERAGAVRTSCDSCTTRAALKAHGAEEWVAEDARGLEHGWTLPTPPPGAGPVRLHVDVVGGRAAAHGGALRLHADAGHVLDYREPRAWDATGRALPIGLLVNGEDLVVEVDDAGAVYPIEVDPLLSAVSLVAAGPPGASRFGSSLAASPDLNGDGAGDLIVGTNLSNAAFRTWVVKSGGATTVQLSSPLDTPTSPACTTTGASTSGGSDVDGDGLHDVLASCLVGAPTSAYAVAAWRGAAGGPELGAFTATDASSTGFAAANHKVAGLGDINGDGFGDAALVESASVQDVQLTVWPGGAAGFGAPLLRLTEAELGHAPNFGLGLAGPVDINGDGLGDLVYAVQRPAAPATSELRVHFGGVISATPDHTLAPPAGAANWCKGVSAVGDVNGDGYGDVACAADIHLVYVYVGSPAGLAPFATLSGGADWSMQETLIGGTGFGSMIAGGGDLEGDGYDDILVGAPTDVRFAAHGTVALYRGGPATMTKSTFITGPQTGSTFGHAGAIVPDMDGDGRDEMFVGDQGYNNAQGRVYWYATAPDDDQDGFYTDTDCDDTDPAVHPGAPEACDQRDTDCDGLLDNGSPDADGDGTCDTFDFMISVTDTVAGQPFTMSTIRGPANTLATFMVSTRGANGNACYPGSTVCISLQNQIVLGQARTDANGVASMTRTIPANLAVGTRIWVQVAWVVTRGGVSGDVSQVELRTVR